MLARISITMKSPTNPVRNSLISPTMVQWFCCPIQEGVEHLLQHGEGHDGHHYIANVVRNISNSNLVREVLRAAVLYCKCSALFLAETRQTQIKCQYTIYLPEQEI